MLPERGLQDPADSLAGRRGHLDARHEETVARLRLAEAAKARPTTAPSMT
jgi:hypothetical protein